MRAVGIAHHRVFPHDVEGPDFSPERRRPSSPRSSARVCRRVPEPPRPLRTSSSRPHPPPADSREKTLGRAPMSQAPWTLFCPRSGIDPRGRPSDMAGQHGQVGAGFDVVRPRRVLGDAHRVDDHRLVGRGIHPGRLLQVMAVDPGNLFHDPRGCNG